MKGFSWFVYSKADIVLVFHWMDFKVCNIHYSLLSLELEYAIKLLRHISVVSTLFDLGKDRVHVHSIK